METDKAASPELERLNPFVGSWETTGEMKNPVPGQAATFTASDRYEWLSGAQFLLHHFEAEMPDGKTQGIEVIGYDPKAKTYPMHSFDSTGAAILMQGRVEKEVWTFTGETMRFTGGFRNDGQVFGGVWESRLAEGDWQPLMEITLKKTETQRKKS